MDNRGDFVAGIVLGVLVGAAVGVLFAPAAGVETRRRIGEACSEYAEEAKAKGSEVVQQAKASAEELAAKAKEGAKRALAEVKDRIKSAGSVEEAIEQVEQELA